ncbi:MAG: DNA-processing protein DprA [Gemmatimonadetes bacterium]|nr:DNA-processing protein DprA [Gemmatimonadota bacterium]
MPLSTDALRPLLRLSLVPGIGPQRLTNLLRQYGSAERVFGVPPRQIALLPGFGPELARRIVAFAGQAGDAPVRHATDILRRAGAVALAPDDPLYPDAFRTLAEPPFLLFAAGEVDLLRAPAVAFVGTRSPSPYGRASAIELAEGLARAGYTIVSGMARGIDTEAHQAALAVGGTTVGVLGHGIDTVYPPENRALFRQVRERGLLLTEFAPGERPKAGNFPRRNRLIAALSRSVVVVEMGLKSGAQHTVNYALEHGQDVMAVPGPIGSITSAGTNQLIRDGARMVTSVEEILEELEGVGTGHPPRPRAVPVQPALPLLAPDEDRVVRVLSAGPMHVDSLAAATGLRSGDLLGLLLGLELRGVVEALAAKHFRRR